MIRVPNIAMSLDATPADWPRIMANLLKTTPEAIRSCRLVRRAVDARRRDDVHFVVTLDVSVAGDEAATLRRARLPQASILAEEAMQRPTPMPAPPMKRPVVVGSGPAGLFAALTLAQAGAQPLLIERGRDARTRRSDVEAFWKGGTLDPESNVQFGEGGAGTFSDGKLNTGIRDSRCRQVLEAFVQCGAPEEILWQAKPHIGTDYLVQVVHGLRAQIASLGGEVRFATRLRGLHAEDGVLRGIRTDQAELDTDAVALCVGHSARDTFEMLAKEGVLMQAKPFSIGVRIEHPQVLIDQAQYGRFAGHPALGAADYKLSVRLENGRGVYTFCMCPGGVVVAAASEPGGVVTNGMSVFARDSGYANSALLVDVRPEDFEQDGDPLAGMRFQRHWEWLAFEAGGGGYHAPAQAVGDFLVGRSSVTFSGHPSYRPGVTPANLRACLPAFVTESMAAALPRLDRRLRGFASPDAVLIGVETRSSSPVRILRDETGHASVRGLFPAGEGAGYAGGITSAAVDGIRTAERMLAYLTHSEDTV